MRLPIALLFGLAIGLLLARPAAATEYTLTITGTIDTGVDTSGVFGHANTPLDGAPYTLSISIDGDRTTFTDNSPYNLRLSSSDPRSAIVTATVNGVTYTQAAGNILSTLYLAARTDPNGSDQGLAAIAQGNDGAGTSVSAELRDTDATTQFVPNLTLNQAIQHAVRGVPSEHLLARFSVSGPRANAHFTSARAVTVTYSLSDAGALAPVPRVPPRQMIIAHAPWHAATAWLRVAPPPPSQP